MLEQIILIAIWISICFISAILCGQVFFKNALNIEPLIIFILLFVIFIVFSLILAITFWFSADFFLS